MSTGLDAETMRDVIAFAADCDEEDGDADLAEAFDEVFSDPSDFDLPMREVMARKVRSRLDSLRGDLNAASGDGDDGDEVEQLRERVDEGEDLLAQLEV